MYPAPDKNGGPSLDRRRFLRGAVAGTVGLVTVGGATAMAPVPGTDTPTRTAWPVGADSGAEVFAHGVASGDPLADRVVLWTRVSGVTGLVGVGWQVASDPQMINVVAAGIEFTDGERDHTIKIDPILPVPGTTYWYEFTASGATSIRGRTRTAPAGATDRVAFALVSCSNYTTGYFNGYAAVARRDDLDAVIHVGDWFYEYAGDGFDGRGHQPNREIVSLDDYRTRHAQYRTDEDLAAVMQQHPFVVVWDDHESTNNSWSGGAQNHQEDEGDWQTRKSISARAYDEWMPVRLPDPTNPLRIWRRLAFGDLVDLFLLDTRLPRTHPEIADTYDRTADDADRSMLGLEQRAWLLDGLATSTSRWRVLGQQTMMSPHRSFTQGEVPLPFLPDAVAEEIGVRQGGGAEGTDNWGAYAAERSLLLDHLRTATPPGNVVLSGDIHTAWACDVVEDPYTPTSYNPATGAGSAAVELTSMSITSNNAIDFVGDSQASSEAIAEAYNLAIEAANPNVIHHDVAIHGYVLVDITPERTRGEFWQTGPAKIRNAVARLDTAVESVHGTEHLVTAIDPSATPVPVPAPAVSLQR